MGKLSLAEGGGTGEGQGHWRGWSPGGRVDLQPSASVQLSFVAVGATHVPLRGGRCSSGGAGGCPAIPPAHLLASGRRGRAGGLLPPPAREPLG